ncbi:ion channel [Stenotrophomonas sp. CC120223-11]|uniref:ion channel n=1 Tax=Stenotrophomonas sp. CC120223-11 TaxID=1378090 RepID=UPI00114323E9|nr:ion channel [Stenotrophomonas sp. CC120223-11]
MSTEANSLRSPPSVKGWWLSSRPGRLVITLIIWALLVNVFALIYYCEWRYSSDAFIINRQFNLDPINSLQARLMKGELAAADREGYVAVVAEFELDELNNSFAKLDATARDAEQGLRSLSDRREQLERERVVVVERHDSLMASHMQEYRRKKLESSGVNELLEVREARLRDLEEQHGHSDGILLSVARLELADARVQHAEMELSISSHINDNFGEFPDPATSAAILEIDRELGDISSEVQSLNEKIGDLYEEMLNSVQDWKRKRTLRLEYIDFVYFSAGVSTSTTFGDIIPNRRRVRVEALSQLFISVVLVGYFVSLVSSAGGSGVRWRQRK